MNDASVNVSVDALHLVLSGPVSLALISRTDIRSVAMKESDEGSYSVSILWRNSCAESLTKLTFQNLRDARRVVRLIRRTAS
jgi:hypothetical protein